MKLIVALGNPGKKYAKTRHNVGFMAMDFFVAQVESQSLLESKSVKSHSAESKSMESHSAESLSAESHLESHSALLMESAQSRSESHSVKSLLESKSAHPLSPPHSFAMSAKFDAEILKYEKIIFAKPQTFMNASGSAIKRIADFYKVREILVIHDDLDLRFGAVRFKFGGGNAGHNGLKSIDALLGCKYGRVRIGIGKPQNALESKDSAVLDFVLGDFSDDELKALQGAFEVVANAINAFIEGANIQTLQNAYTKKV